MERLYANALWSPARETEIAKQKDYIGRMEEGRKTIAIPSILKSQEAQIEREREKLTKMVNERAQLIGMTAEVYAQRRLEDHYMVANLFTDIELKEPLYTWEDFDNLPDSEVDEVHEVYREAVEPCSEGNLRKLAVQDFFMSYYVLCAENPAALFDKAVCELTYSQVRLLNNARYFKALLDNTDLNRLPLDKRGDPDAIESLHISQKNMAAANAEGRTPNVGLSAEDIKATGQQFHQPPPAGVSGVELIKWMQKQQVMNGR